MIFILLGQIGHPPYSWKNQNTGDEFYWFIILLIGKSDGLIYHFYIYTNRGKPHW
jgi:hypothetical protein